MADKNQTTDESPTKALDALMAQVGKQQTGKTKALPPVDQWNPDFCGDLDMVIKRDGTWFYNGTPIGRAPLVRLFSTILRKDEDGKTYLITPVEKVGITVEDAHFVAVTMDVKGQGDEQALTFHTSVGDEIRCDADHPLRFEISGENDELKPYLAVRGRLEALLARPVMYDLVNHGEEIDVDGTTMFAIRSAGDVFPIMPAAELARLSGE